MLLCTLCLDVDIRDSVRDHLHQRSFGPLLKTAGEFLSHFRTVEQAMVEEDASKGFTQRFDTTLLALKKAEGMA